VSRGSPGAGAERGRLTFRPPSGPGTGSPRTGRFDLSGVGGAPPAAVYVPTGDDAGPLRLLVMLHGAGGVAASALGLFREHADRHRLLLLAPKSTGATWDVISGGYGPDVRNIDGLLGDLAASYPINGYTVGGFSDGASYALSLGLANGDVFDSVVAFSPGFEAALATTGRLRFFVSHGTDDRVLPIDRCSRRIVPRLLSAGYDVSYREFEGGHTVPGEMRRGAVEWLDEAPARASEDH
jgi:predicted esterase